MEKYRRFFNRLSVLLMGVILISLFLHQCTFKSPSAPVWDVGFIIPLISEQYTMEKLADESDNIEIQGDSVLFNIDHELDPIEIGDYLKTDGAQKMTNIFLPDNASIPFDNTVNDILTLPDSIIVDNAVIKSGQVYVTINNHTAYGIRIDISIPSLQRNGNEIPITFDIDPWLSSQLYLLPLNLAEFNPGGTNQIAYSAKATITEITGNQGGNVEVNVNISDIYFQELTGTLNRIHLGLEDESMEINLPDELEGFRIESANLKLALRIGVQIPIIADLTIEAINPRNPGYATQISFQDSITNVTGNGVMVDTLEFPNDPEVADFINGQPEEIVVSGSLKIGDGLSTVTVSDTHKIKVKVLFKAPLTVTLPDYITETDPDTIEIEEDGRERLRDNLMSVNLEAVIENHLPLGAIVTIFFDSTASDSATLYNPGYTPNLTIGPLQLDPASVAGTPGLVTGAASSTLSVDLDKEQLELFERPEIFFGTRLEILDTAGQMVQVRPTDYIDITAQLNAVVRTKIPEDEDDEEEGGGE